MWAKLLDVLLGSLVKGITDYAKAERERKSYEEGVVAKADKERLQKELEDIIRTGQIRRRAALDPVFRNSVRTALRQSGQ